MNCPRCNYPLRENENLCWNCGAFVPQAIQTQPAQLPQQQQYQLPQQGGWEYPPVQQQYQPPQAYYQQQPNPSYQWSDTPAPPIAEFDFSQFEGFSDNNPIMATQPNTRVPSSNTSQLPARRPSRFNQVAEALCSKVKNNKRIGLVSGALVVVTVLLGVIAGFSRSEKPEAVVKKYYHASMAADYDMICKYSAINLEALLKALFSSMSLSEDEIKQELRDKYGTDDIKKMYEGPIKESLHEGLKNRYGSDYTISVSVSGAEQLSDDEMQRQIDEFWGAFADVNVNMEKLIPLNQIKAMSRVRGRIAIEGSQNQNLESFELYCLKIDGKWRVLDDPASLISALS